MSIEHLRNLAKYGVITDVDPMILLQRLSLLVSISGFAMGRSQGLLCSVMC
jgi:hypothetical protein